MSNKKKARETRPRIRRRERSSKKDDGTYGYKRVEYEYDMRGNEGVDIRKIKEGGESLEMIAMVRVLANQEPRSPPCPRTRRHCRPNEDPD